MDKSEMFRRINERRKAEGKTPVTEEEFVAVMSSLEVRGILETNAEGDCRPGKNAKHYAEVKTK